MKINSNAVKDTVQVASKCERDEAGCRFKNPLKLLLVGVECTILSFLQDQNISNVQPLCSKELAGKWIMLNEKDEDLSEPCDFEDFIV